jgi:putative redox protein
MTTSNEANREAASKKADSVEHEASGWVKAHLETGVGFRTEITVRDFAFVADEPKSEGGTDGGATPYEYLLGALAACTAMTLRMYAKRKAWPLEDVVVRLREARSHAADCGNCETEAVGIRRIEREVELRGAITDEQRERLLQIANRCPIKQTLERGLVIDTAANLLAGDPDVMQADRNDRYSG